MRFILTADGLREPPNGIIPDIVGNAAKGMADALTDKFIDVLFTFGTWVADKGLLILAEGCLVWGTFCFLMAITGTKGWMERGIKGMIGFALVGVAAHAV